MPDVVRLQTTFRLGLHVNTVKATETVEVVDVSAAHRRRHRREDIVDRNAQRAGLFTVEVDFHLRVVRVEGREDVTELRPLAGRGEKLSGIVPQLVDSHRAAAILDQEVESRRRAKSGEGRNIEGKDDRLRYGSEVLLQLSHDPTDLFLFIVAFLP